MKSNSSFLRNLFILLVSLSVVTLMSSFMNRGNIPAQADAAFQIPYINITHGGVYEVSATGGYITFEFDLGEFLSSRIPVFNNSASFIDDLNDSIYNQGDLNFSVVSIEQSETNRQCGYMTILMSSNISPNNEEYVLSISGQLGGRIRIFQAAY